MSEGKTAVLFPGQGSQYLGMGREFAESDKELAAIFETAEKVSGFPIRTLCFDGPMEQLTKAPCLQPALTAVNLICWQALKKAGVKVDYLAGHSLGEYSALHAAKVLSLPDTLQLVAERGRLMGAAGESKPGGMTAILGITIEEVKAILGELDCEEYLSIGNHNSEQQIVLSGAVDCLKRANELAVKKGAKAVPLNVSIANHSPLMNSAVPEFERFFAGIELKSPEVPVLFNVSGSEESDIERIRQMMARQIVSMVRWYDIVKALLAKDVVNFIEVGPKKVLSGLMKRILPRGGPHNCFQVENPESLAKLLEQLKG